MYQKVLWCYLFILSLLDTSLNTKLTAQGESHGVTIHESLVEGITFQEWGKESSVEGLDSIDGSTDHIEGVTLEPRALKFGRSALAAPHSRTVTLTNTANTTLHLASVAGTTPDFHASFFESKTLPPQGNTTFNVVYLGRREGPVSAHLYIHTSLGVHKYPVSAVGVASEYAVWPLLGLRVPLNATLEPELRLHNPTDTTVQVREVYSTGAWLRLRLPGGGARAHRDLWAVPPRSSRTLVLLRATPQRNAPLNQPLIAYIRIKADIPGGGLVVAVEARSVPAGEYARPLHVCLGPRGSRDASYTVELEAANSGEAGVSLEGGVRGAGCWRGSPPPLPCATPTPEPDFYRQNGAATSGVTLTMEQSSLAPYQPLTRVATLTLNYGELWAQMAVREGGAADEAWCAGCVRLGRAHVPFSVHLLPGGLHFSPEHLDIVTAAEDALREHTLRARNDFAHALRVHSLHLPPEVADHFHIVELTPLLLRAGESAALLRMRLRSPPPASFALAAALTVHTNLSQYTVPVRIYSGRLIFEWDWVNATSESLDLGAVGTSWTRRVGVRLRNPAPVPLCLSALEASLPGASASLALAPHAPCVEGGRSAQAWLTVVAPAREASLRGVAVANTSLAGSAAALALRVRAGHVRAHSLHLPPAAPYAGSTAELEVESSMSARMRVTAIEAAPPLTSDHSLLFDWEGPGRGEVAAGLQRVALVSFAPERRCEPRCYTGLDPHSEEGEAWTRRGEQWDEAALREDVALLNARLARYAQHVANTAPENNFTLHLHTTEVLHVAVSGSAKLHWPRLAPERAGVAALAAVGRVVPLRLSLRNPARVPLLLHAVRAPAAAPLRPPLPPSAGGDSDLCADVRCSWSREAFAPAGWRATHGEVSVWNASYASPAEGIPALLLQPHAEIEIGLNFSPSDSGSFTSYLYLRNNLTILEGVQLYGQGEYPTFDIGGKRPGTWSPFLFEVKECSWSGVTSGGGAVSRRALARNLGRVRVELSGWSVARGGCTARGWRLLPCGPLALAPNASAPLHFAFAPDYSLSRITATLQLQTDLGPAEYYLMATIPAKVITKCAAIAPRPPWEGLLRSVGTVLAFAAFALVLAAAAVDAERILRRARADRPPATEEPLDLRNLASRPAPANQGRHHASRRRRPARRPMPVDPRAERRAFERWRAEVLRREEESSRSSEDADPRDSRDTRDNHVNHDTRDSSPPPAEDDVDVDDSVEDTELVPPDEDGRSTGSDVSTPCEDRDDADEPYGGDEEPDPRDDSPSEICEATPPVKPVVRPLVRTPPTEAAEPAVRPSRPRRDPEGGRRSERTRLAEAAERRGTPARHHPRKERPPKRRSERAPPTPPPRSPAPGTPGASEGASGGRSWSAVVSGPPLAPIGSDVRRREPQGCSDNSLFYFNGTTDSAARSDAEFSWRPPIAADRPAFTPARDYLDETHNLGVGTVGSVVSVGSMGGIAGVGNVGSVGNVGNGGSVNSGVTSVSGVGGVGNVGPGAVGGGYGSVWGGGGWNAWGSGPLRPPPGFAPPSPPTQRSYDPFQSLASIWAPAPHEWRPAPPTTSASPAHPAHSAPKRDRQDLG